MIQSYKKKPELQEFSDVLTTTALTKKNILKKVQAYKN